MCALPCSQYVVIDITRALCSLTMLNEHEDIVSFTEDAIAPSCELWDSESQTKLPGVTIVDVTSYYRFIMGPRTALSLFAKGDVGESMVPDFQELYDAQTKLLAFITLRYCLSFRESEFYKYSDRETYTIGIPESQPDLVEVHNHHKKLSKHKAKQLMDSGVVPSGMHTRMKAKGEPSSLAYVMAVNEGLVPS